MKAEISFLKLALIVGPLFVGFSQRAAAYSGTVNGFGWGTATVRVWCAPNAPPNPPNHQDSQDGFVPTASVGPGLAGCNPNTWGFLSGGSFWRWNERHAALGGDVVDDPDLLSLVTPTSSDAEGVLFVSGTVLDPFTAEFTISWAGSDAGVATYLAWYEGDTLLDERLQIGPWAETITVLITSTGPIEDVELRPSGAAVSLP